MEIKVAIEILKKIRGSIDLCEIEREALQTLIELAQRYEDEPLERFDKELINTTYKELYPSFDSSAVTEGQIAVMNYIKALYNKLPLLDEPLEKLDIDKIVVAYFTLKYGSYARSPAKEAIEFRELITKVLEHLSTPKPTVPSIDEMSKVTSELIEENFPKGLCKERGKAIVLHAQMLIAIQKLYKKEAKNVAMER